MKRIIAVVATGLLIAGCSNQPQATTTPSSPSATPGSGGAPGAPGAPGQPGSPGAGGSAGSAASAGSLKLGDTHTGTSADVTVEQFNPKVTTTASDQTWQAALVKTCVKVDGVTVSTQPWQAIGADSGRYRVSSNPSADAPKPLYPSDDESVLNGECVRGWILFDAPATVEVVEVRYSLQGGSPVRWMLR